jgi:O-antigen polysaccharide polymerase Wzy
VKPGQGASIAATACGLLAVWCAVLFTLDVYVPLPLAIVGLFLLAGWGLTVVRLTELSLLPRLMILLYVMPFSVTLGYLGSRDYTWWWTPTVLGLLGDRVLIEQMMTIGITGLAALLGGLKAIEASRVGEPSFGRADAVESPRRTLDAVAFGAALGLATALSWIYAPRTTIFEESYAAEGTEGLYQDLNFYGAFLASYVLLVLLFVDAEHSRPVARRWKRLTILVTTFFIMIFLQLLRGDREIVGLLAALTILYVTEPMRDLAGRVGSKAWRRMLGLALPMLVLVVVLISVGAARFELSGGDVSDAGELLATGFTYSTWTAVLLTNLGMAAQLQEGRIEYLYGETYLQYFLSLVPGIITHYLGLERPIEATSNPNYWFVGISSGGNHVVNVPFKNFGIFGVVGALCLYGMAIGYWERIGVRNRRWNRLVYGAIIASSFKWFWYADMNVIRALMGAGVIWLGYHGWLAFTAGVVKDVRWADTVALSGSGRPR